MAASSKVKTRVGENIELGFVEEVDSECLLSYQFPSKVGGLPAWLSLKPLPCLDELQCRKCDEPTVFLLQVYAPRDHSELTFHRTIFIFICRNPACCQPNNNDNLRVFRSHLARINDFYSPEPPTDAVTASTSADKRPHARDYQTLCVICGAPGPKTCSRCHKTSYCSKLHQTIDWKAIHKTICKDDGGGDTASGETVLTFKHPNVLFPEFELVTEKEDFQATKVKSNEDKMKEYREFLSSDSAKDIDDSLNPEELDKMATKSSEDDEQFQAFKDRIRHEPEQVLRFDRGGEPLWISASNTPSEIPTCSCGSSRQFEFQVLPQLLCQLDVDSVGESLDWGVMAVYTCSQDCDIGNKYQEEFIWKQDLVKTD
ncbi:hypothetical protein LOTGIDRAFT_220203 [Lottia gigantea]|uniref:MYND-type domain-containing protein n=1 Tax=Lottia gigantea TaxID=225164 RepID=V3ZRJ0_LOTGI|nr:hypothetical protein LOTGIDRAFT_220203 [Lottia gigantea]ESO86952.1 hypothetical protein LOTGIDRAFT_220203 [Lottia gigantea]